MNPLQTFVPETVPYANASAYLTPPETSDSDFGFVPLDTVPASWWNWLNNFQMEEFPPLWDYIKDVWYQLTNTVGGTPTGQLQLKVRLGTYYPALYNVTTWNDTKQITLQSLTWPFVSSDSLTQLLSRVNNWASVLNTIFTTLITNINNITAITAQSQFAVKGNSATWSHTSATTAHGSSATPAANGIVMRDSSGKLKSTTSSDDSAACTYVACSQYFTPTVFTITYNLNGGTNNANNPATYTIKTLPITFQAPTKLGYTFGTWSPDTTLPKGTLGNKTETASWTVNTYTITYSLGGGTNNASNPSSYTIEQLPITLGNPSRTGYNFSAWSPYATIPANTTGNLTITASWTVITYTITYTLNGGTNSSSNPSSYNITTATITLANPTRTGYNSNGWFSEAAFTNQVTTIPLGSTGNKSLYAKWTVITYTITYTLNGGTNSSSNPSSYNITTATITLANPTRTGYNFSGWFSEAAFTNQVTTIPLGSTGNKTLYAKWTAIVYTITYNVDGAFYVNPSTYTIEQLPIYLLPPNRPGFVFMGWSPTDNIPAGTTGNLTFTASWTKWTALWGGGSTNLGSSSYSAAVDYRFDDGTGSTQNNLRSSKDELAATRSYNTCVFAGGADSNYYSSEVDLRNNTGAATGANLSSPRDKLAGATAKDNAIFAGGIDTTKAFSRVVDYVFNTGTSTSTGTNVLSVARAVLGAATALTYDSRQIYNAIFGGGLTAGNTNNKTVEYRNEVGAGSTGTALSAGGGWAGVASAAEIAIFAGGDLNYYNTSTAVDYRGSDGTGGTGTNPLSVARAEIGGASTDWSAYFVGGYVASGGSLNSVSGVTEVRNARGAGSTGATISGGMGSAAGATAGYRALFAGGYNASGGMINSVWSFESGGTGGTVSTLSVARQQLAAGSSYSW